MINIVWSIQDEKTKRSDILMLDDCYRDLGLILKTDPVSVSKMKKTLQAMLKVIEEIEKEM